MPPPDRTERERTRASIAAKAKGGKWGSLTHTHEQIAAMWERHHERKATDPAYALGCISQQYGHVYSVGKGTRGRPLTAPVEVEKEDAPPEYMPELWEGAEINMPALMEVLRDRRYLLAQQTKGRTGAAARAKQPFRFGKEKQPKEEVPTMEKSEGTLIPLAEVKKRRADGETWNAIGEALGVPANAAMNATRFGKDLLYKPRGRYKKAAKKAMVRKMQQAVDTNLHKRNNTKATGRTQRKATKRRVAQFNEALQNGNGIHVTTAEPSKAAGLIRTAISLIEMALKELE